MTITALPTAPSRSDTPATFVTNADAFVAALPTLVTEVNAATLAMNLNATSDTSASSVAIGTGAKTFTVTAGKSFLGGMFLVIADTAAPSTNWMFGQVTSYSSTSLVMNILSVGGSGTKTAWTISQSAVGVSSGAVVSGPADIQAQTATAFTTGGSNTAYTLTPTPALAALATNQRFRVNFHTAAGATPTLAISGLTAKSLKYKDAGGNKQAVTSTQIPSGWISDVEYDGTDYVLLDVPALDRQIQPITASVGSNALTITLNPTTLDFRSATLTSGTVNTRTVAAAISVVVSSGSTLGTVSAQAARLAVLAIDNAGTVELAVTNLAGGAALDESGVITTTAEGGAGAADSASVIYSTTARSNVPYRVVGFLDITEATAGTWATAPSTIQGIGGQALAALSSLGFGQTWQTVTRALATTYYNTTCRPIYAYLNANGASSNYNIMTINGIEAGRAFGSASNLGVGGIVPPGGSYSWTATGASVITASELR